MEIMGFVIFGLVKYFGYFFYLKAVEQEGDNPKKHLVAFVRLFVGIIIGLLIYAVFETGRDVLPVYFSAILVGRILIWYSIFSFFYKNISLKKRVKLTVGGTFVSYLLDLPATFGVLTIIGGIC